jgi:hypothetical protein
METSYLFSFKSKTDAEIFYTVAKKTYHTVNYIGSYDKVALSVNLSETTMKKHIKRFKLGNFGIEGVKVIN